MPLESRPYDVLLDPIYASSARPGSVYKACPPVSRFPSKKFSTSTCVKRPMVPHLDAVSPSVLLAPTRAPDPLEAFEDEVLERVRDAMQQTDFRESEAQTEPYAPEFAFRSSAGREEPEVLMLAELGSSHLQPTGLKEVEMIEEAQAKRRLESCLPPATDPASLALRKKLLESQELREFGLRQREMDEAHNVQLEALSKALQERDEENEFVAEQRVEALRRKRMDQRDEALEQIQAKRIQVLRKLSMARGRVRAPSSSAQETHIISSVGGTTLKKKHSKGSRDVITDYAAYASKVYAPLTRDGAYDHDKAASKKPELYDVAKVVADLGSSEGLLASTVGGDARARLAAAKHSTSRIPKVESILEPKARSQVERQKLQLKADLERASRQIQSDKDAAQSGESSPQKKEKKKERAQLPAAWREERSEVERPPTPRVARRDPQEEELEAALKLVQRLLRGRAVQNQMFQGKESRIELIRELRRADELAAEAEQRQQKQEKDDDEEEESRAVADAAIATIAGEAASALFDLFAKELARQEQEDPPVQESVAPAAVPTARPQGEVHHVAQGDIGLAPPPHTASMEKAPAAAAPSIEKAIEAPAAAAAFSVEAPAAAAAFIIEAPAAAAAAFIIEAPAAAASIEAPAAAPQSEAPAAAPQSEAPVPAPRDLKEEAAAPVPAPLVLDESTDIVERRQAFVKDLVAAFLTPPMELLERLASGELGGKVASEAEKHKQER